MFRGGYFKKVGMAERLVLKVGLIASCKSFYQPKTEYKAHIKNNVKPIGINHSKKRLITGSFASFGLTFFKLSFSIFINYNTFNTFILYY
jgi:hypothetical protein